MTEIVNRRLFLSSLGAAAVIGAVAPANAFIFTPTQFLMWHSPGCGCCLEWAKRMGAALGRKLPVIETTELAAIKKARGVPADLQSCHTAIISGYVVEGHVPPADIQRLVKSGSRTVRGLAVPGMPSGAPGMDIGHHEMQSFKVFAFDAGGRRSIYAAHG